MRQLRKRSSRSADHWDAVAQLHLLWPLFEQLPASRRAPEIESFLEYGEREIDELFDYLAKLGVDIDRSAALDFGCGPGRLTQALAARFDHVYGVDISPAIIEVARHLNEHGSRCTYVLNHEPRLTAFSDETFDFVCTFLVLQHIEPPDNAYYVGELIRVLKPRGVAVFQVPDRTIRHLVRDLTPAYVVAAYKQLRYGNEPLHPETYLRKAEVQRIVERHGARVVDIQGEGRDTRYCCMKLP